MPQPGDGDLWPTNDDDRPRETPSTPVKDTVTHESPVPDEPKKPPTGGWFDPPSAPDPTAGRDKSHAEPAPRVSWPIAELEKQAKTPDAEKTASVRTLPTWPNSTQSSEDPAATSNGEPKKAEPTTEKAEPTTSPDEQDGPADSAAPETVQLSLPTQPEEREDGDTANLAVPDQPEPSEPAEVAATQADEPKPASQSGDSAGSAEAKSGSAQADLPAESSGSAGAEVQGSASQSGESAEAGSGEPDPESQPAETPAPESAVQEGASQDGGPAGAGSGETVQLSLPAEAPGSAESEEQESASQGGESAEAESGEPDPESQPAETPAPESAVQEGASQEGEPAEAESGEPDHGSQPAESPASTGAEAKEGSSAEREADRPTSGDQSADTDEDRAEAEPSADDGQDSSEDTPATAEKDQRGGDHPTVIGQVGGDGTRTGLRAVVVDKTSSGKEAHAWPDEQADGQESPVDLFQPGKQPKGRAASWFDTQDDGRPATRPWPTDQDSPTSDTTVNLTTPAAEPPKPSEPPRTADSARTVSLPTPTEPVKPAGSASSAETAAPAKPAEQSKSTESARPDEPARSAELAKPAAPPKPSDSAKPGDAARFGEAAGPAAPAKPPKPAESARPAEWPKTAEPPRSAAPDATRTPPVNPTRQAPTDSATVFFPRPAIPQQDRPKTDPPSFIRPRQEAESTTFIPRIPQPAQPDQRPERQQEWPPPEPPRAAPQRVGPQPQEPAAPRKKKKPLLIVAVALVAVIGLAAGVVFGVPGLAAKLGLAGDDAIAVAPPPAPITYRPGLHGPDSGAPVPTKAGVESALAGPISSPALGTVTGVVIDPATGEILYERSGGQPITPASTGKILTAAAALLSLDHTEQLVTKVVQGEQPGEVIIVGGGDPTISSLPAGEVSMYPGAAHLDELVEKVRNNGVDVRTVYIDQSRYAGPGLAPSWLPEDVGDGYIAPIVPAMLDGDREDPTVNYSPRTTDPGRRLVDAFASRIGAAAASSIEKKAPANAKVLGEIRSAPLAQLVDNMLDHSDNTLGDILAHEVAVKAGKEPSFDGAAEAMLDILRQNGFDVDGVVLRDGSGMSIQNKMSAKVLAQVLAVAAGPDGKDPRTNKLRPLLGGLPVAGGSGTLEERYGQDGAAAAGRGWVRAKTGTLSGVNSLAGIVLDQDGRPLVFAFLTEGTQQNSARPALDVVAAALRGCGCQ